MIYCDSGSYFGKVLVPVPVPVPVPDPGLLCTVFSNNQFVQNPAFSILEAALLSGNGKQASNFWFAFILSSGFDQFSLTYPETYLMYYRSGILSSLWNILLIICFKTGPTQILSVWAEKSREYENAGVLVFLLLNGCVISSHCNLRTFISAWAS